VKIKKVFNTIIAFVIIAAMFTSAVSAALYTTAADDLNSLGLFIGTDKGYELDREPTRAEAAVMLVRLLGKEAEAKEKNYEHPFTDVRDWADPYVGYLYENGLTKGIGDNKFGMDDLCSAQMFCTFVLRALGYTEESGDFTYDKAIDFAVEVGIIDEDILAYANDIFNRDCCVIIMYNAVLPYIKGTETTVLEKLVLDKAVDEKVAGKFIEKNEWIAELIELFVRAFDTLANKSFSLDIVEYLGIYYDEFEFNKISVIDSKTAYSSMYGTDSYVKDGYIYTHFPSEIKIKRKAASDFNAYDLPYKFFNDIYYDSLKGNRINKIEKGILDNEIFYKITIIDKNEDFSTIFEITYTFTPEGEFRSNKNILQFVDENETVIVSISSLTITATGDDVKIDFPDFSDYEEIE